jgi:hypothetical protein
MPSESDPRILRITAGVVIAFGLLTIIASSMALSSDTELEGLASLLHWFDFLAGNGYVITGIAIWAARSVARILALSIVVATGLMFGMLALLSLSDSSFAAWIFLTLALRAVLWMGVCVIAYHYIGHPGSA